MYLIEDVNGLQYKVKSLAEFCKEKEITLRLIRYTNPKWKDIEGKRYQEYHKGFKIISEDIEADEVENEEIKKDELELEKLKYKSTEEICPDGTHKSDKLLQMDSNQSKDPSFLLNSHGFNSEEWELLSAKNNIWNAYSKQDGIMTLYSSKIVAKPKIKSFDLNWYKEQFEKIEPIDPFEIRSLDLFMPQSKKIVELNLCDLHIGLNGVEYEDKLKLSIDEIIEKHKYAEEFILPIGQDWLNSNVKIGANFTTVRGTSLEQNLTYREMVQTGIRIGVYIIESILSKTSANIDCLYIKGNHDEHSSYILFCALMQRYHHFTHDVLISKRIYFDDSMKPRKYRRYGVNGIGFAHGENEGKKIYGLFQIEAPQIFANTNCREFHLSHLHHESVKDENGIIFRRLPTPNSPDEWHENMGFLGSTNRIQVFVYDYDNGLDSINYYYLK